MVFAVQISDLSKRYGSLTAIDHLQLEIPSGEFLGLLGPNGAGKSTLINCIVGLAKPTTGEVKVFGHSVRSEPLKAKSFMGFSPQEVNVERFFNLRRTLEFQGGFYGLSKARAKDRAQEMLEQFGLVEKAKEQFFRLSGGMRKRLLIARAMMGYPKLLILDEPTAGVDVAQRHELWKYLSHLNRDGTTIILTTHYIDEAQALCERVGIINHGRILELGSPAKLIDQYCESKIRVTIEGPMDLSEFRDFPKLSINGNEITMPTHSLGPTTERLMARLTEIPGRRVLDLNLHRGNLEEVFLRVTGKTMAQEADEPSETTVAKL